MEIKFKPEFGNPRHIRISEMIGSYEMLKKSLNTKRREAAGVKAMTTRIQKLQADIDKAIENENRFKENTRVAAHRSDVDIVRRRAPVRKARGSNNRK